MKTRIKKRLFVCCDGTWNRPSQRELGLLAPTNVLKFSNALVRGMLDDGVEQRVYYHPGVGVSDAFLDRVLGGAFGQGLGRNIRSAYRWLCENYREGDEIYVVGFSRGAFTARSLVGMVSHAGLIRDADYSQVRIAYEHYQHRKAKREKAQARSAQERFAQFSGQTAGTVLRPNIEFLGVWDTVGSLGIPQAGRLVQWIEKIFPSRSSRFHDLGLSEIVQHARHALAIDEQRQPFMPTLWEDEIPAADKERRSLEQLWFPGVHSDVGGGYLESGLSESALHWMIVEAARRGAVFDPEMCAQIRPDCFHAPMHDTLSDLYSLVGARPRPLPPLVAGLESAFGQRPHSCALSRRNDPPISDAPYRPTYLLSPGESYSFDVYARSYWNAPGIFLQRGQRYRITAQGEWQDAHLTCSPEGECKSGGRFARLLRCIHGWLRRVPDAPWFALMASIGHTKSPDSSNDLTYFPTYCVGSSAVVEPQVDGYVYFFANDMGGMYGNNRGHLAVTLSRLPADLLNDSESAEELGKNEPDLWTFAWRWSLSVAVMLGLAHLLLFAVTWLGRYFNLMQDVLQADWWLWLRSALSVLVVGGIAFYTWFFGRSDTRVEFVEVKKIQ